MQPALERSLVGAFVGAVVTGLLLTATTVLLVTIGPFGPRSISSSAIAGLALGATVGSVIGWCQPRWPMAGAGMAAVTFALLAVLQLVATATHGRGPTVPLELAHLSLVVASYGAGALTSALHRVLLPTTAD